MASSQEKPWSDNPNAPKISYDLYFYEKAALAGAFIGSILYGITIILFFQCMAALFSPVHRKGEHIKWGLVFYTTVMFLLVTVFTAPNLKILSTSYIDNRGFPGVQGVLPPGVYGYKLSIAHEAPNIISTTMSALNNWLADGLLLYRCYVIYSKNIWAIAFPCLMYLCSLAMGLMLVCQSVDVARFISTAFPYLSVSVSLNILLTLMIVIRLILHTRNVRTAMGMSGIGGLYKTIIIMLIESCVIFAVNSVLVLVPMGIGNPAYYIFMPILCEAQVVAPLLVIRRVASKSAVMSNTVASVHVNSVNVRNQRPPTGASGAFLVRIA